MSGEEPATQIAPVESPQMVSTVKLPILKKGEYTLWSMRMEQYLTNTNYSLWQVILNGDGPIQVTTDENGVEIESRFGGNVESKKMQKNVLKQQFENFSVSDTEGLDKAYDRNKASINDLDIDDLYNNLKVFGSDIKGPLHIFSKLSECGISLCQKTLAAVMKLYCYGPCSPQLDDEDLEQIDHDDLEEIDLKWQVLIELRLNALTVTEGAILQVNDNALIVQDGLRYDWSYVAQDEPTEFALMACTSNSSGSDTEGNPQQALKNKGIFDSDGSRHMQGTNTFLNDFQEYGSTPVNTASALRIFGDAGSSFVPLSKFTNLPHDLLMPDLEDTTKVSNTGIFGKADFNNMKPSTVVSPNPTTRVHSIHPKDQIIGAPSWVEAIQEELLQFKIQKMDVKGAFLYGTIEEEVGDEAINETMFDSVEKALTTDASLDVAQDNDNITKTQSTTTLNEPHTQGEGSGSGPWRQKTMRGDPAQTRFERVLEQPIEPPHSEGHTSGSGEGRMEHQFELTDNVPITPYYLPLPGGYTPGSDEGRLKLQELMTMCTKLYKTDKEKVQSTSKNQEEERNTGVFESSDDDSDEEDASKQGRKNDKTNPMLHESDFDGFGDETVDAATTGVSTTSAPVTTTSVAISTAEPRTPPTTTTIFDDEDVTMAMAQTLIKTKEEKAKEKGVALKDVEDYSRPVRSITTLQPLPSIDPKDKDKETIAAQRKFRAAQRAVVCRRDPPTINLIRNLDDDFSLKNMGGYKYRSYATQKSPKKPKVMKSVKNVTEEEAAEYEKEKEELRLSLKIISGDDSEVNYEPLSRRFPIVNWEYKLLGNVDAKDMYVYKLTRADGSSSYHGDMQAFLRRLDRQDLNDLYRLVQERFQDHPLEGHDLLLWGDLRMLFDPDEKDELWMNQLDWKLLKWKLYESCGVHTLFMDGTPMEINMLVEKKYPLIKELLEKMLNLQLEAEEESTMAFELIKFIKSMLEE
ncbi:hypothetical protein Tco_0966216 [Tanacetum coccineum]